MAIIIQISVQFHVSSNVQTQTHRINHLCEKMSANPYKAFGLSCPNGGDFHICENTKREFIGCCTEDPCADGSGLCEKANLRAASFSESSYLDIQPQSCDSTGGDDHFYTCTANDPPFIGCCTINPCVNKTCPSANLRAAVLSSDHDDRASFLSPSSGKSSVAQKTGSNGLSSGAIAGIVISLVALLILVAGFVLWKRYNWNPLKSSKPGHRDVSSPNSITGALMDSPKTPGSGHTNSSAFSTHAQLNDPRSVLYPSASASPQPSYKQYQSARQQHSPDGQWHMAQTTQTPPATFHPQHRYSRAWPFQSPSYETYPSPSPKMGFQNTWQNRQPVHELLAEVQSSNTELPVEEPIQELSSSCVVQPLRPPPPVKGLFSGGKPDSPTLGPPLTADRVHPRARAAVEGHPAAQPPTECQNAQDNPLAKTPKPRQAQGGHGIEEAADLSWI